MIAVVAFEEETEAMIEASDMPEAARLARLSGSPTNGTLAQAMPTFAMLTA